MCASHRRVAFSRMASNTGCRFVGELLMTFKISAVAVCCSSASVTSALRACSSLNSRTFSIAITAWSAKVLSSLICLSVKGRTSRRRITIAPIASSSRNQRRNEKSPMLGEQPTRVLLAHLRLGVVGDMQRLSIEYCATDNGCSRYFAWRQGGD